MVSSGFITASIVASRTQQSVRPEERPDPSDSSQSALAGMSGIEGRSLSKAARVKSPLRR